MSKKSINKLNGIARQVRYETVRMMAKAGSGHPGGSLSAIEILTVLYFHEMNTDPSDPKMPDRDRFVLSKGHAGPALYAVLAEKGFFPREWLDEFDQSGSRLPKHVNRLKTPGIEVSTGPLGQGFSVAVGMALAERLDRNYNYRIYTLIGDGECNSGQIWEAAATAAKYHLDNLICILDKNCLQIDGRCDEIMPMEPLLSKWVAFNWYVIEVDGHDVEDLLRGLKEAKNVRGKPVMIIANTIKGKGVSFMENKVEWHSAKITPDLAKIALSELEEKMVKKGVNANK